MSALRCEAIRTTPRAADPARRDRCERLTGAAANACQRWSDATPEFEQAHRENPPDDTFIRGVYGPAEWFRRSGGPDVRTAAIVCFYEQVPKMPDARRALPRFMPAATFDDMRGIFRYKLDSDEELDALVREFYEAKAKLSRIASHRRA